MRAVRRDVPVTLLIVASLALAIGFNAAVFSFFHTLILSKLPYAHSDRLVTLWSSNEEFSRRVQKMTGASVARKLLPVSPADARDWIKHSAAFEALAVYRDQRFNIDNTYEPIQVVGLTAEANLFEVLGVQPVLGTLMFSEAESGGDANVVVLGHSLWQRAFAGHRDVLGKEISLNNEKFRVIGIAPAGVVFPRESEVWIPLRISGDLAENRQRRGFEAVARLRPGATISEAQAVVSTIASRLQTEYPLTNDGWAATVVPLRSWLVGNTGRVTVILVWAVALITAIASGNVAGLLLGKGAHRAREYSIRRSLGASSMALTRLVVTESIVLALIGACGGLAMAHFLLRLAPPLLPETLLLPLTLEIAAPTIVYTFSVALGVALVSSILPTLQALGTGISSHLQDARSVAVSRHGRRLRSIAVGVQLTLTVVLLVGASLMLSTLRALASVSVGADVRGLTAVSINFAPYRYPDARRVAFARELAEQSRRFNMGDVGIVDRLPFGGGSTMALIQIDQRSDLSGSSAPMANLKTATGGYFRTMRISLLQGRYFDDVRDTHDRPGVAIVNKTFADRYWRAETAVGRRIKVGREGTFREIVGVVNDVRHSSLDAEAGAEVYLPFMQSPSMRAHLMLRSATGALVSSAVALQLVHSVDAGQAIEKTQSLEDLFRKTFLDRVILGTLLATFGFTALILALVGVSGNVMAAVNQRTSEVGIRMALGATRGDVLMLVLRSTVVPCAIAIGAGLMGGVGTAELLRSQLYGVRPLDPLTFVLVPMVMLLSVVLAAYYPARRAANLDPAAALRRG